MGRHLPAAAAGVALGKIFQGQIARRHAPAQNQAAIAIVGDDIIVRLHLHRNRRQRLVAHSGNVKMSFALAIKILLAQIGVAALQHQPEKPQFVLLCSAQP